MYQTEASNKQIAVHLHRHQPRINHSARDGTQIYHQRICFPVWPAQLHSHLQDGWRTICMDLFLDGPTASSSSSSNQQTNDRHSITHRPVAYFILTLVLYDDVYQHSLINYYYDEEHRNQSRLIAREPSRVTEAVWRHAKLLILIRTDSRLSHQPLDLHMNHGALFVGALAAQLRFVEYCLWSGRQWRSTPSIQISALLTQREARATEKSPWDEVWTESN